MPEPALPDYLNRAYAAKPSQRGGTLIAEDVWDLEQHRSRVTHPDGYRPDACPACGAFLEGHGCRARTLRDQPQSAAEDIRRYRCPACHALWQVLPAFLARHVQRTWGAVQSRLVGARALKATGAEWRVPPKPGTLKRWLRRVAASAIVLTQALAQCGAPVLAVIASLGAACSRAQLIEGLADRGLLDSPTKMAQLASWIHRLVPGVRLM